MSGMMVRKKLRRCVLSIILGSFTRVRREKTVVSARGIFFCKEVVKPGPCLSATTVTA